ncbi:hypothetical protein L2E82_52160 [Cichorium intybus]|nr:hypothetical protein L2E82_52160 [Cichorium intybus]
MFAMFCIGCHGGESQSGANKKYDNKVITRKGCGSLSWFGCRLMKGSTIQALMVLTHKQLAWEIIVESQEN